MELFTPELGLVFWMFVAFILLFLVLAKWGWPVIITMMDKRAATIDEGVENARKAKEQLDNARQQAADFMNEARAQQQEMIRDAQKMKTDIIEQARQEASIAAQREMDAAKDSIDQARKQAESQIRDEVSKFSIEIAEKMMRQELKSDKAQTDLANKLLDEIDKKN